MSGGGGPRVLLAAGRRDLERRLARELAEAGLEVGGRCLDGPSLLERAGEPGWDAVLASCELHRLSGGVLAELSERRMPVVLLAGDAGDASRLAGLGRVLPASSPGEVVAAALRQAAAPGAPAADPAVPAADVPPAAHPPEAARDVPAAGATPRAGGRVVALTSGKGAPGKTTVAIALAALLAEGGSDVVLADLDLRGGNVAPCLDLDPRRGLAGLAAAGSRLDRELQEGPGCPVLAGVERPELAAALHGGALSGALSELRARFGTVVADLGAPPEPGLLRAADELLLVTGADLVSVWNARTALPALRRQARAAPRAVVNRRDGRGHYGAGEVSRALGAEVLGVVREDRESAHRALSRQVPLSAAGGAAAPGLRALARALAPAGPADPADGAAAAAEAEWLAFGLAGGY